MRCDVVVIGAGPAGAFAALNLARQGIAVRILEEHRVVGLPVDCSGIVGPDALAILGLEGLPILGEVRDLTFVTPGSLRVEYRPSAPLAYVLDRARFDQRLAHEVVRAGGCIETGWRVTGMTVGEDGVRVRADGEEGSRTVEARIAILAGGPRYGLQQALGMGVPRAFLRTAQTEVQAPGVRNTQVYLGREVAPGSFAWLIPFQREGERCARVGVGATEEATPYLEALLSRLRRHGLIGEALHPTRHWPIPLTSLPRTYGDRVLAVGDAAGQTKPTSGGGIFYGLLCAKVAADVAAEALRVGDCSAGFLSRYDRAWRGRLGSEIRAGHLLRRLFNRLDDADIDEIFRTVGSDGILPMLSQKVRFDWHGDAIYYMLRHPMLAKVFLKGLFRPR